MSAFERRTKIFDFIRKEQRASTRRLSETFQVSEVTIRHDLAELEDQGWIARIHGGAAVVQQPEQPLALRETQNHAQKVRIAQAAAQLVVSGDRIVLDSSSTAFQLALELKQRTDLSELTIVTNNLHLAQVLAPSPRIDVLMVGGFVRAETWSTVGPTAEDMLSGLHVGRGFFGAAGITLERGLTDADIREVQVKRALMRAVDEIVVVADASKFGKESFSITLKLQSVQHVITDSDLPSDYVHALQALNLKLTLV